MRRRQIIFDNFQSANSTYNHLNQPIFIAVKQIRSIGYLNIL